MTPIHCRALFLDGPNCRLFVLLRTAKQARRAVLFVPPFAEEMNKCRRQFTETASALVEEGLAVVIVDLSGTGDSEGEFADATWANWKRDLDSTIDWVEQEGMEVAYLVATRLGCILAAEVVADRAKQLSGTVFWQPVSIGSQYVTQFLRLRTAASLGGAGPIEDVEKLKEDLVRDGHLEVAGYKVSRTLFDAIDKSDLMTSISAGLGEIRIFEIGLTGSGQLSVAGRKLLGHAAEQRIKASGIRLQGEPFWSSTEIVVNHELIHGTVRAICSTGKS